MNKQLDTPAGYEALRQQYDLKALPHFRTSYITSRWDKLVTKTKAHEVHFLPASYDPGPSLGDQLEFALKYEGIHLELLARLFEKVSEADIVAVIREKPVGQYRRRIWFLYEFLTSKRLPIPDARTGGYVPLASDEQYYVAKDPTRSPRHRVTMNLLGTPDFFPLIRKTERLREMQARQLDKLADETVRKYPPELLARAVSYLYTKETKSSFQIEREQPDSKRAARFVELLRKAEKKNFLNKEGFIELHQAIVDQRFAGDDYRDFQNYVGETRPFGEELIHYVCPQPQDVPHLMQGLIDTYERMVINEIDPVIIAATISFGFVFIHPFEDGNGRIHRFLLHNILARSGFTPAGVIFPISSSMLQQIIKYDQTLESFSAPLLPLIDWKLGADGDMTVTGTTVQHYRYLDFTHICEQLYDFIADTIDKHLPDELNFLARYDAAKRAVRSIAEMPDRLVNLFVKVCALNNGKLSKVKRESHFAKLTDEEVEKMELAIASSLDSLDGMEDKFDLS